MLENDQRRSRKIHERISASQAQSKDGWEVGSHGCRLDGWETGKLGDRDTRRQGYWEAGRSVVEVYCWKPEMLDGWESGSLGGWKPERLGGREAGRLRSW